MDKKMSAKQAMIKRVNTIIENALYANGLYLEYVNNPEMQTVENYKALKNAVGSFNNDKSETVQVSRFGFDEFKVYMLNSFKVIYPKQYKAIINKLATENVNVNTLIEFNDIKNDALISKQLDRAERLKTLVNEIGEVNNFDYEIVSETYHSALNEIKSIEKAENTKANVEFANINLYKLCVDTFKKTKEVYSQKDNTALAEKSGKVNKDEFSL